MENSSNQDSFSDRVLQAIDVCHSFGELTVLDHFNISLRAGEFVSLIGPSGCGKTTLLKILAGLMKAFSGEVRCFPHGHPGLFSSVVFQDFAFFPWLNIYDNIKLCLNAPMTNIEKDRRVCEYLERVRLLDFQEYFPGELSEGMIQRANVARALASRSQVILMDEPFVHLDFLSRTQLQRLTLEILSDRSRAVFFITHNIHEAVTLSDRIVIMSARPGKNVKEILVDLPRPRDVNQVREDRRYLDRVREVTELLTVEDEKAQRQFQQWIKNKHSA